MKAALVLFAALCLLPVSAQAQRLNLQLENGRVTLTAANVSVRQILMEWGRIGGVNIVNVDKVASLPVTLQLQGVPEAQALQSLLRGVSGYMLAPRRAGSTGASIFDRILIMPPSSPPRAASTPPSPTQPGLAPRVGAGFVAPGDDIDANGDNEPDGRRGVQRRPAFQPAAQPGFQPPPPPPMQPPAQPRFVTPQVSPVPGPPAPPPPTETTLPGTVSTYPQLQLQPPPSLPPGTPPSAANPFGIPSGSGAPGTVGPAPPPEPSQR
jgi:hypothetical protein